MTNRRISRRIAGLSLALVVASPNAANASPAPAASKTAAAVPGKVTQAPTTSFRYLRPWTKKGALRVSASIRRAPTDSRCSASNFSRRKDAYRCHLGNNVIDPAFKSPSRKSIAYQVGTSWKVRTHVASFAVTKSETANIVTLVLSNGARCTAATGAGPAPLPKYPYWVGLCTGGPYGKKGAIWRATDDDGKNSNYPLLASNAKRTRWVAPIEHDGTVTLVPVRRAYR